MHENFVCHCHIPKTGGSALNRRVLFPHFGEDGVQQLYRYVFENAKRLPEWHVTKLMRAYAAAGHVPFGYVNRVYPGALYVAVMREPIDRTLSFLNFVLNTPDHKVHERLRSAPAPATGNLDDPDAFVSAVLNEPRLAVVQSNVQTRLISGAARLGERPMGREDLAVATANIARPNFAVGDQARLEDFMTALATRLPAAPGPERNVDTGPRLEKRLGTQFTSADLSPRTLGLLEDANALDLELYAKASALPADELACAA